MTEPIIESNSANHPELIPALTAVTRVLDEAGYKYNHNDNDAAISATFPVDQCDLAFRAKLTEHSLFVRVRYSLRMPEERRTELALFLNAINWRTILDNLEMDPEDGEITCRVAVPIDAGRLTLQQADAAVHIALGIAYEYAKPIVRMALQNVSANEALESLNDHN